MTEYREFDFNHPDFKKHRMVTQLWLKAYYNKPVTEAEYVEFRRKTRPRKPKDMSSKKWHRKQCPYKYKRHYEYLKRTYGFFGGIKEQDDNIHTSPS